MGAIRLLSDHLINRIAAGEVVERPASVLKELIENSLDAGATHIRVEAKDGGRRLIAVHDNGQGMSPDDLLLAVERHATSKLAEETDLLHIDTLGFRGEALPSIAAVSRLTITTSAAEDGRGSRLRMSGGKLMGVEDAARDRGSSVEARDLFFNVPARRKFLKSHNTEAAHMLETVQRFALGKPEIRLIYRHNDRESLSTSPREDDRTRLARILGREAAGSMFPFEGSGPELTLNGYLGRPEVHRGRPSHLYLFVNGRPVSDRLLTRAVLEAYRTRLPQRRYPLAVVHAFLSPDMVDVNVHPAKAEVRFRRPNDVFRAAVDIMEGVLEKKLRPLPTPRPAGRQSKRNFPTYGAPGVREASFWEHREWRPPEEPSPGGTPPPFDPWEIQPETSSFEATSPDPDPMMDPGPMDSGPLDSGPVPFPEPDHGSVNGLFPIGQLFRSYVLAQGPEGLFIVDQHAAHERILFERLKSDLARGVLAGQTLLLPETLELTPTEAIVLEKLLPELGRYGFDLEHFGGQTFILRGVPAILGGRDPVRAINDVIDGMKGHAPKAGLDRLEQEFLESLACHSAIKAGDEMTLPEMERLLSDLGKTRVPTNCPHGRPLVFQVSRRDIEKRFARA